MRTSNWVCEEISKTAPTKMKPLLHILLALITSLAASIRAESCQAGSIEPTDENAVGVGRNRVFLNLDDPAQCDGQVYGWHVCRAQGSDESPAEVILAMYHEVEDSLVLVLGSYREISVNGSDFGYHDDYGLECLDLMLETSDYFRVKRGDVVGACWEDSDNRLELAVEYQEKYLVGLSTESCSERSLFSPQSYFERSDVTLLLSAYINIDECILGESRCHENATCSDVVGGEDSYNCTCKSGYTGDGLSCAERDAGNSEGATETSRGTEGSPGSDDSTPTTSSASSTPQDSREKGNGATVGATVAAIVVVFLIVAVVVASVLLYLSRQKIERALGSTTIGASIVRGSIKKRSDTLATGAEGSEKDPPHDYDYVTVAQQLEENQYEMVALNRTPLPALTRAHSSDTSTTDYEIPIQSLPYSKVRNSFDQQPKNSPQYEVMLSAPSVKPETDAEYSVPSNRSAYTSLIRRTVQEHVYEALSPYQAPASKQDSLYAQLTSYNIKNISRENLAIVSKLGTGQFGKVSKAVLTEEGKQKDVAVKTLTDSANTVKFLQEAAIMAQFRHPNILTLHGVVSTGDPKVLVFELMHNGELKSVVTNMRPTSEQPVVVHSVPLKLLDFSKQVALGLHYLSCRGFVHRDLAARNILVSQDLICKIADFGLSRDLAVVEDDIYVSRGGKIPLKWCAPEAIFQRKYSTASDVWSYGCVLYEIWSLGHKPFETYIPEQVMQLLKKGHRLPPPPGCPKMIYKLMIDIWHPEVPRRPQSRYILKVLLGNVDEVLAIPPEDVSADSQAAIVGAPLDKATHLYQDLQNTYAL